MTSQNNNKRLANILLDPLTLGPAMAIGLALGLGALYVTWGMNRTTSIVACGLAVAVGYGAVVLRRLDYKYGLKAYEGEMTRLRATIAGDEPLVTECRQYKSGGLLLDGFLMGYDDCIVIRVVHSREIVVPHDSIREVVFNGAYHDSDMRVVGKMQTLYGIRLRRGWIREIVLGVVEEGATRNYFETRPALASKMKYSRSSKST